jgi:hypothetical protein
MVVHLTREGSRVCCEFEVEGPGFVAASVACRLSNLQAVINGVRYHIAGNNTLCSISRNGEFIEFDAQIGNLGRRTCLVPIGEFEKSLLELDASSSAYLC